MFSSALRPGEFIIDDSTPDHQLGIPDGMSTGYKGMFRSAQSAAAVTFEFPTELEIPEPDWQGWIQEKEERENRISDFCIRGALPCKDQAQTNFCWANAPTHCLEIINLIQNQPMVIFSPASVACPINGFRNQGGWGEDALQQIIKYGAVPVNYWPANAIDKRYYTQANKDIALKYRVTEWFRLIPRNKKQLISCLLRNIPVACGYNWQGHETTACDAVWVNGQIGTRNRNSWTMDWPTKNAGGWYILQGFKMLPDDAVASRVATAVAPITAA